MDNIVNRLLPHAAHQLRYENSLKAQDHQIASKHTGERKREGLFPLFVFDVVLVLLHGLGHQVYERDAQKHATTEAVHIAQNFGLVGRTWRLEERQNSTQQG